MPISIEISCAGCNHKKKGRGKKEKEKEKACRLSRVTLNAQRSLNGIDVSGGMGYTFPYLVATASSGMDEDRMKTEEEER